MSEHTVLEKERERTTTDHDTGLTRTREPLRRAWEAPLDEGCNCGCV